MITAAGVSSGIDMALTLAAHIAGDEYAQGIQLGIEYDPEPPFDSGSTEKASPEIVELVKAAARSARLTVASSGAWSDSPSCSSGSASRTTSSPRTKK